MPKLAIKRDTDYRLSVMIHGEMGAQNVKPEKAAEYALRAEIRSILLFSLYIC